MLSESAASKGETVKWTWCGEEEDRNEGPNHIHCAGWKTGRLGVDSADAPAECEDGYRLRNWYLNVIK